ncbi:MAG TPA: glycosyltransferase family 4 protein, partial [Thermoanaerobaculia bacterium]|nr:glycosyltransferase family 4 protein [Thermoanaerobaculia bacterium]
WFPGTPACRRLADALLPPAAAAWADLAACRRFDRQVAARLPAGIDAVVACEISALATFRAARRRGVATLLDAPSFHHWAQDRVQERTAPAAVHRRVADVKDGEIALADHVLTVSELARESYVRAGVPPERVHALPLGADLELFAPAAADGAAEPARDGFTFLFAGASLGRKGFDLLVEGFARVAAEEPSARLRVVGPRGDAAHLLDRLPAAARSRVAVVGPLPQAALAAELRRADLLVLPSRHDSYGMAVAEALACGVPALVSSMVGAKDLVRSGESGWVVPAGDGAALARRMVWCARHAAAVRALRPSCRRAAEAATWESYHRRLVDLLLRILPARRAA